MNTKSIIFAFLFVYPGHSLARNAPDTALHARHQTQERKTTESIVISAHHHPSANGVTGLEPGGGLIRPEKTGKSISTVRQDFIQKQAPAQNLLQLTELLPGVVVGATDPFGVTGGSISVRGLDQSELGLVWEGAPAADVGIYTIDTSNFGSNENLEQINVQQGSSNTDTPTINASGGLLDIHFRDPSLKRGSLVTLGYGSYNYNREFIRLDTGEIGQTGVRSFMSFSHQYDQAWRGPGNDKLWNIDWKALKEWGDGNRIALVGTYRQSIEDTWPPITLSEWKTYGRNFTWNNHYTFDKDGQNYWHLNRNPYDNLLLSAPSHFNITDKWHLDFTPYFWRGYGDNNTTGYLLNSQNNNYIGTQTTSKELILPYAHTASDGSQNAMSLMAFQSNQYRGGFTVKTDYQIKKNHDIYFGWWFDYANQRDRTSLTSVNYNGYPTDIYGSRGAIHYTDGTQLLFQNSSTITTVNSLFTGDRMNFFRNHLFVDAGIKVTMIRRDGTNELPGPQYKVITNDIQPLPVLTGRYQFNRHHQVFAGISTSFRSPSTSTLYDAYYGDGNFYQGTKNLKDEYSISEEIGYRYNGSLIVTSLTYFHYNFTNRQIQTALPGTNGGTTIDINAGGQTSDGISVEAGTRPFYHFRPYISAQYLHTTTDNNISLNSDFLPTKGKTAVRSPRWTAALGIDWDNGKFFWNYSIRYAARQYSSLINDEYMPAYYDMNASMGVRFRNFFYAKSPTLQLNFINLTNNHYLSGIQSITTNSKTTSGTRATSIDGSPANYIVAPGFATVATLTVGF